eukprot:5623634-Ditylum_brightwellii.AAC.1
MQIATIPAFLVNDGFNTDLRAKEVYKRVISLDDQTPEWVGHTKALLKVCVVKNLVSKDKPYVDNKISHQLTTREAKTWAKQRFIMLYTKKSRHEMQPDSTTGTTSSPIITQELLLQTRLKQLQQQQSVVEAIQKASKPAHKPEELLGMSSSELKKLLKMCGLLEGEEDLLPDLFHLCAKKGQIEDTKDCIITEKLQSNKIYTDVDIPATQQLLKMIRQRKWAGEHPIPMATTAPTGLSPYAVGPMTEEEVVNFNLTVDAVKEATHTTVAEI